MKGIDSLFLENLLESMLSYLGDYGYWGMEPHMLSDLYFTNKANISPTFVNRALGKLEGDIISHFPFLLKPYLVIQGLPLRQFTPYSLGFFLQAFSCLNNYKERDALRIEAARVYDLLVACLITTDNGNIGYGNAVNQKAQVLGDIKTSRNVIYACGSSEIFLGLIECYKSFGEAKFRELALSMAGTFENEFHFKVYQDGKGCFDYSNSGDNTHILNANALIARSLLKSLSLAGLRSDFIAKAYEYNRDYLDCRFIPYAGSHDKDRDPSCFSYDCYHTGFLLRSMYEIDKEMFGGKDVNLMLAKVNDYLLDFGGTGIVTMFRGRRYDIHSLAEYIRTFSTFRHLLAPELISRAESVIINSLAFYQSKKDKRRFMYGKSGLFPLDEYMPLWGHSCMMASLASLLLATVSHQ